MEQIAGVKKETQAIKEKSAKPRHTELDAPLLDDAQPCMPSVALLMLPANSLDMPNENTFLAAP